MIGTTTRLTSTILLPRVATHQQKRGIINFLTHYPDRVSSILVRIEPILLLLLLLLEGGFDDSRGVE